VGRDWPLDQNELDHCYCQAEWGLGVSGNHDELDRQLCGEAALLISFRRAISFATSTRAISRSPKERIA